MYCEYTNTDFNSILAGDYGDLSNYLVLLSNYLSRFGFEGKKVLNKFVLEVTNYKDTLKQKFNLESIFDKYISEEGIEITEKFKKPINNLLVSNKDYFQIFIEFSC